MSKIVVLNRVSLDGYFASNDQATWGMSWFVQDPDVEAFAHERIHSDTLLLGGQTFRGFERMWVPLLRDPNAPEPMKVVAQELTDMTKVVFSRELTSTDWDNTEFHSDGLEATAGRLREADGADLLVLGSGSIVQQLAAHDLIDEYVLIETPVIAGSGKRMFAEGHAQPLTLLTAKSFGSGNAVLHYEVQR
ncbi:dihydrofolate reductase family protein [Demequina sp. TTPB684]|uniref:dihydrofolate reductase family protein n=1 Tax=unclassified Demequina TaxID=2620311 RepID=UPI001CF4D951|nr:MULTISPECIES: dihydrofolate reductase family protein [unclassified Demequina]MCB2412763.1 dihydrofolate reductase family protein [Demequina sp. TTPB684]UPU88860.1 dihydrofolate reductase family protein [Demequina sp. TMPB413]